MPHADPSSWQRQRTLAGRPLRFRPAPLETVLDLRYRVLIVGTDRADARFPGDREADTTHFGAFDGAACVGCATLLRRPHVDQPAWQLRGMAVEPGWRGLGVGAELLDLAEAWANTHGPAVLWCNARLDAAPFYARHGWAEVSDPFDIPGVAPHVEMRKRLPR